MRLTPEPAVTDNVDPVLRLAGSAVTARVSEVVNIVPQREGELLEVLPRHRPEWQLVELAVGNRCHPRRRAELGALNVHRDTFVCRARPIDLLIFRAAHRFRC